MKRAVFLKLSLSLFFLILTVTSCSVVELDQPPTTAVEPPVGLPDTETAFALALAGNESTLWKAITFQLEGLAGFQACRLDDTFMFMSDGTYRYDGGEVLCGGADDRRVKTGIWELNFDNAEIIFDRDTDIEYSALVLGLSDNKIQLRGGVDIFGQTLDVQGIYQVQLSN